MIGQVVAEDPTLAEAGKRYLERQMGPQKHLRYCIPLPGTNLRSVVTLFRIWSTSQTTERVSIPSPLKPVAPVGVLIEDVTH